MLREATLNALWRQWAAVGAMAAAESAQAVVDPEALVLASLWFAEDEPRLRDLLASWTVLNAELLSVQRLRNVATLFPERARKEIPDLARLALESGKDFRWKPLVREGESGIRERPGKVLSVSVPLGRPPALMLRLRALLGVGMRADVTTFLLSSDAQYSSAEDIAAATVYSLAAVRRLLRELVRAGGLAQTRGRHPEYSIKNGPLARLGGASTASAPGWRHWVQAFALVTDWLEWWREARGRPLSPFVMRVNGEEFFERHREVWVAAGLIDRGQASGVGEQWAAHLTNLATWIGGAV